MCYTDLKERNCVVAQKWSQLSDDDRKAWSLKAEAVCEASLQRDTDTSAGDNIPDSAIIEKALITIQEKVNTILYHTYYSTHLTFLFSCVHIV